MKKVNLSSNELPKHKERHLVSWTQEEDDILREQIRVHGTENWAIIASKFKDKTTRQCRRRWFTYLNSDFKKGGWSPEEDILLCEAQKIYGNRWTEIAKVVSGRTDNAVKNRFTTLCKKKAKENSTTSYINLNNKRVIFRNVLNTDGGSEGVAPLKKTRSYTSSIAENLGRGDRFPGDCGAAALDNHNIQTTFIKKDDPKVIALMQQAELLSSLAIKVNTENTDQSLENAWMALQDFLEQDKESEVLTIRNSETDFQVEKFKELTEEIKQGDEGSRSSWREPYESSPTSSEYSTGSTLLPSVPQDKIEECEAEICVLHQETGQQEGQNFLAESNVICHTESTNEVKSMLTCDGMKPDSGAVCEYTNTEFRSPIRVTPLFRSLAAAIPSPKFSESEKHFLMKTLGMESTSPSSMVNSSQTPHCKRSLLHCL